MSGGECEEIKGRRAVIIGGAEIGNYGAATAYLRDDDFLIYCDSGLRHEGHFAAADLIVGDFDSHPRPERDTEIITLPCEKDDTDTMFAAKEALRRGFSDLLLLGVSGGRLDHTLGNVYLLYALHTGGARALMIDDFSEMEIVSQKPAFVTDKFPFFSLVNISGTARGITIEDAKFPLTNAEITPEFQYGLSNEPLPGKTSRVSVKEGALLLVRDR